MANEQTGSPEKGPEGGPKKTEGNRDTLAYLGVCIGDVKPTLTLVELKALARKVFVQVSGTKAQLIARIINQILTFNNLEATESAPHTASKPETSKIKCASFTATNKKCSRFAEKDGIYCTGHKHTPHTEKVKCSSKGCTDTAEDGYKHCSKHNSDRKIPCKGFTKQGKPCLNSAQSGKAYCARHEKNPNTDKGTSGNTGTSSGTGNSWYDFFWGSHSRQQAPPPPPVYVSPTYGSDKAFVYFGLSAATATYTEVKKCYRKLALIHHPDKGGKREDFVVLQTHYDTLTKYYGN